MQAEGKRLRFDSTLWVQTGGVRTERIDGNTVAEAIEDEAFVKVLNHFGRALKLYVFENDAWVDADTGAAPAAFDAALAGRIAPPAEAPPAPRPKPAAKASGRGTARKAAVKADGKGSAPKAATTGKARKGTRKAGPAGGRTPAKGSARRPPQGG